MVANNLDLTGNIEIGENDLYLLNGSPATVLDNGGNVKNESVGFTGKVYWHIGSNTGTFSVPAINEYNEDVTISAFIDTPGTGPGVLVVSTYPVDSLLQPLPPGVPNLYEPADTPAYDFHLRRYWMVDYVGFTTNPVADVTIHYVTRDYGSGSLNPSFINAQRWTGYGWSDRTGTSDTTLKTLSIPSFKGGVLIINSTQADPLFTFRIDDYATLSRKLNGSYYIANDGLNFKYDEAYHEDSLNYAIYDQSHNLIFGSSLGHNMWSNYGDNRFFIRCHCYPAIFTDGEFYTLIVTNEKGEDFMLRFRFFYKQSCKQYLGESYGLISGGK